MGVGAPIETSQVRSAPARSAVAYVFCRSFGTARRQCGGSGCRAGFHVERLPTRLRRLSKRHPASDSGADGPGWSSRLAANAPGLQSFGLAREQQAGCILSVADANGIAAADLSACHEIRERVHQQAFDSTFERPRPVTDIGALRKQELFRARRHVYGEWIALRRD